MARTHRLSMTAVVIVCLLTSTVAASEPADSSSAAAPAIGVGDSIADVAATPDSTHATLGRFSFDAGALHFETPASPATGFVEKTAPFRFSAGQIVQGPPYPYPSPYHVRHNGAIAAIMIGAAAAITGTAVLVYANRPECTFAPYAGGCGYGTKVVGGAVLAGGIVGLFVGAVTW
jgi:hypothetical protein